MNIAARPETSAVAHAGELIVIRGRKVVPGVAEGEALVTTDQISGWGGVDPRTGTVIETRHQLRGQSFAGKVLVFPGAKGSSGWSAQFHLARVMGTAPAAWLFNQMTTKMALGAVVSHAPAMTDFDIDPLTVIRTGDWVRVDADAGVVTITRKQQETSDG
jgi:predicted aconitase with swiveling domain